MRGYRLYLLDGSGRFTDAQEMVAKDDEDALAKARGLKLPVSSELWERDRMVAKLDPTHCSDQGGG